MSDTANSANQRVMSYINNAQGLVMERSEIINGTKNRFEQFFYANSEMIGDVSNDGPSWHDYVQDLKNSQKGPVLAKDWKPIASADFDQNFRPINQDYPSSAGIKGAAHETEIKAR